jgi:hypothetical protein
MESELEIIYCQWSARNMPGFSALWVCARFVVVSGICLTRVPFSYSFGKCPYQSFASSLIDIIAFPFL